MDGVVHFEIPADDVERAKAFYATVFDWQMQHPDMQYTIIETTPVDEQTSVRPRPARSTAG